MLCRTFGVLILTFALLGSLAGCDNRPKYVLPSSPVPPPTLPVAAGGGAPAKPAAQTESREKLGYPREAPADSSPSENKK